MEDYNENSQPNPRHLVFTLLFDHRVSGNVLVEDDVMKNKLKKNLINWKASQTEHRLFTRIIERFFEFDHIKPWELDKLSVEMDLIACHCNDYPLDLERLLFKFDDFDFLHDVVGIMNHINRDTAKLENLFIPRCALYQYEKKTSYIRKSKVAKAQGGK